MERILLLVMGNFPTSKAYGVTTTQTLKSIRFYGHQVACAAFRPFSDTSVQDNDTKMIYFRETGLSPYFRKFSYTGFGLFAQLFWKLACHSALSKLPKDVRSFHPTVIWVRELIPYSLISEFKKEVIYVIELHELIKNETISQLSNLPQKRVVLAPISPSIEKDLERYNLPFKVVLSPMGVDLTQFDGPEPDLLIKGKKIKIGYFGKLAPGGFSKGYEDLIELAAFHQSINFPSHIQLVGADSIEIENLKHLASELNLSAERIEFISHQPHSDSISLMQKCDILVLTSPKSNFYHGSPIKAIEYAATGKPILAARSTANEDVFTGGVLPSWYTPGDIENMHTALVQILNSKEREVESNKMRAFAESRTWKARTKKVLDQVDTNRKDIILTREKE